MLLTLGWCCLLFIKQAAPQQHSQEPYKATAAWLLFQIITSWVTQDPETFWKVFELAHKHIIRNYWYEALLQQRTNAK